MRAFIGLALFGLGFVAGFLTCLYILFAINGPIN
jgi:hypothetical protein